MTSIVPPSSKSPTISHQPPNHQSRWRKPSKMLIFATVFALCSIVIGVYCKQMLLTIKLEDLIGSIWNQKITNQIAALSASVTGSVSTLNPVALLAKQTIQWFTRQMRMNGISSLNELDRRYPMEMPMVKYSISSKHGTLELTSSNAEPFARTYFRNAGLEANDVEQLVAYVNYANKGSVEHKVFEFVKQKGGKFDVNYVAVMNHDGMIYMTFISAKFKFDIAPEYTGWWIFTKEHHRDITPQQQNILQSFFMSRVLQEFYNRMPIDGSMLENEDKKYLSYHKE